MCGGDCDATSGGSGCQNPLVDLAKRLQRGGGSASAQHHADQAASGRDTDGSAAGCRPTAAKSKRSSHKARYQGASAAAPAGTSAPYLGYFDGRHRFVGSPDNTDGSSSSALVNKSCHGCNNQIREHVKKGMGKHLCTTRRVKTHHSLQCCFVMWLAQSHRMNAARYCFIEIFWQMPH